MFVICIGITCRYFVGHRFCICILCETWSLKVYEKWGIFVRNAFVKYMEV